MRFVDIKNDFAFHKIFGNEKKTISLISFINAALKLKGQKRVMGVKIENANQFVRIAGEKASVIDVTITDQLGRHFTVEIQVADKNGFGKRVKYYTSGDYSTQIKQEDDSIKLNPTYFIGILDFEFGTGTNYRSKHIIINEETGEQLLINDIQFCFIQLPKFKKKVTHLKTPIDKWTYFIKNAKKLEVIPEDTDDKGLKEAYIDTEKHKWSKAELIAYDNAFMRIQDAIGELAHARKEGIKEGRKEGKAKIVTGCYGVGITPENIAKVLKMSLDEVVKIIAKHQK